MRVFITRWFERFVRKQKIGDAQLCEAVARAERGLIDADLGGGLIKQRIARAGRGRSGGYRTVIAYRSAERAVFLFGFAKSERDNIDDDDLADLKDAAALFLNFDDAALQAAVEAEKLKEVRCDEQEVPE